MNATLWRLHQKQRSPSTTIQCASEKAHNRLIVAVRSAILAKEEPPANRGLILSPVMVPMMVVPMVMRVMMMPMMVPVCAGNRRCSDRQRHGRGKNVSQLLHFHLKRSNTSVNPHGSQMFPGGNLREGFDLARSQGRFCIETLTARTAPTF